MSVLIMLLYFSNKTFILFEKLILKHERDLMFFCEMQKNLSFK